ncbi:MAG: hypothetical protein QMB11_02385 [Nonlabens sp.]|jgi:hypothetical protein|uniref:hypothetical protein n=1 Tax=Nonlabens sp. TaxID=1888209 RepID=UPI0035A6793E
MRSVPSIFFDFINLNSFETLSRKWKPYNHQINDEHLVCCPATVARATIAPNPESK